QRRQAARDVGIGTGPDGGSPAPAVRPRHRADPAHGTAARKAPARRAPAREAPAGGAPGGEAEPGARFPADVADRVHISLLAGLLSHIGMRDAERNPAGQRRGPAEFAGARGARFAIFPGSSLARKPPQWVVAAELVETSRLWARVAARIEPEWAEPLAAHLVRRTYSEPQWDARRGAAMALERVTL